MKDAIRMRAEAIARQIEKLAYPAGAQHPRLGVVLGSGWGAAAAALEGAANIPFAHLADMPLCGVAGHAGHFICGSLGGKPAVAVQGRFHLYEGHSAAEAVLPVAVLFELGVRAVLLTNAAGAIAEGARVGEVMAVRDHINLTGRNPLVGLHADDRTPFVDLTHAYDARLRADLLAACREAGVRCREGVYLQLLGPSYETPAEIRAFRTLGADAVGMSTAVEVIYARYLGMRVAALSFFSNVAAGLTEHELSHAEVLAESRRSAESLASILSDFAARAEV